jgi:hypothetical protein
MPLLKYLPWFESKLGSSVSSQYSGADIASSSISFPVYDGTLLNFVRQAEKTSLMNRNYSYVYTRNRIKTHDDERAMIEKAGIGEWDILCGILSKYVLGGKTKGTLWNEAVKENIFYMVLKQMKAIIEFWDRPLDVR